MRALTAVRRNLLTSLAPIVLFALCACSAGKFRYDNLKERDGVAVGDLEDLIAAGNTPTALADMKVERVTYDFTAERDEYRIGKNDVLNIYVMNHPELSSQRVELGQLSGTTVRKDGKVYMPVIGAVQAEGLTITEFENKLRETAAQFVVDPQVNIEVLKHESQKFFVLGQVRQPGVFAADGDTTLLEGLALAGGALPEGNLQGGYVVRNGKLLPIDLSEMLRGGDTSRNVYMRGGDLIYIPDNADQKVYVLGEVAQPQPVAIVGNRITLAEALAAAGGPVPARARRELAILRGGFAHPTVYIVDLDKALLVDESVLLRPGDRIVIAPTGLATASRYMEQIMPFLQGVQAIGIAAQGATTIANQAAAINSAAAN